MAQVAALILLVFGLLPIANWIPGGHDAPWYGQRLSEWMTGAVIVIGTGILVLVALRSRPDLWRRGLWGGVAARWRAGDRRADAGIAAAVLVICAIVARLVLSANHSSSTKSSSSFRRGSSRRGVSGFPRPHFPEFTSAMHLLDWNGKVYGQFPAGGPAMLALGALLHGAWLVGPFATAHRRVPLRALAPPHGARRRHRARGPAALRLRAVHDLSRRLDDEPRHRDDLAAGGRTGADDRDGGGGAARARGISCGRLAWVSPPPSALPTRRPSRCRPRRGCSGAHAPAGRTYACCYGAEWASRFRWRCCSGSTRSRPVTRCDSGISRCGASRTNSASTPRRGAMPTRRRADSS